MTDPVLEKKFVKTSFGNIAYLEAGDGARPPVLFVHGIPTSSFLWRDVLRFLRNDFHCYAPDLMGLGDTDVDPASSQFHMDAQSEMLLEFMATLGHERFSVVCHDQGGAAVQILAARRPESITSLVITNCVCYDNWPVPVIARLQALARVPLLMDLAARTGFFDWQETRAPWSAFRHGVYRSDSLSDEAIREYLRPMRTGPTERERFRRFLLAGSPRYSMQAVAGLKEFRKPTMVIWAADDPYLSPSWGKKLFEDIPGAGRFEIIPFCGHFWQEERPSEFASLIGEFLSEQGKPADAEPGQPKPRPKKRAAPKRARRKAGRA